MTKLERTRLAVLAHRTGDALGMPVETMTPKQILDMNGGRELSEMIDAVQRKLNDTRELRRGQTTDDTQLGDAVIRSLIRCRGFNITDQAREHLEEYERSVFGWGGTTRLAMESLKAGRHPILPMTPAAPKRGKRPKGRGNGPIMKIHGLALWHALRQDRFETEPLLTDTLALGRLTHWDIRASIAAYAVAVVIAKAMHEPDALNSGLLREAMEEVSLAESRCRFMLGEEADTVSGRLETLKRTCFSDSEFFKMNPSGFDALDTCAFTIGVFMRNRRSIRDGLIEAVNAGGDTDSHAAIAGAMIGAGGASVEKDVSAETLVPERWRNALPQFGTDGLALAERLYDAATA